MDDYIKREDALGIVAHNCVNGEITLSRYDKLVDGIYEIPSADVAPVRHGRWEDEFKEDAEAFMKHRYVCTVCGKWQTYGKTQYCPNCGSKMDKGE